MTTPQIAARLVELCRAGKYLEAIRELYAPDVQQFENGAALPPGRDGIEHACAEWLESRVFHAMEVLGTHVAPESFVVEMRYDVTPHATKQRHQWSEAAVYRTRGGKIVDVRFYYRPPAA
jgi:hypothetical protein